MARLAKDLPDTDKAKVVATVDGLIANQPKIHGLRLTEEQVKQIAAIASQGRGI